VDPLEAGDQNVQRRYISLAGMAAEMGVSVQFLRREAERGRLQTWRFGRGLHVKLTEYARYQEQAMVLPNPRRKRNED
jgi:hypothetical protein